MRKVEFTRRAERSLDKLISCDPRSAKNVASRIEELRTHPLRRDSIKITGYPCYRIKAGDYRIVHEFDARTLRVTLVEKRGIAYQRLKRLYS